MERLRVSAGSAAGGCDLFCAEARCWQSWDGALAMLLLVAALLMTGHSPWWRSRAALRGGAPAGAGALGGGRDGGVPRCGLRPTRRRGLLQYADNAEPRGAWEEWMRVRALPPRREDSSVDSEGWRGEQDEQANAVGALQIDVQTDGVRVSDTVCIGDGAE